MSNDTNQYISSFIEKHSSKINQSAVSLYQSSSPVAIGAYQKIISHQLHSAYDYFISQSYNLSNLDQYLFGTLKRTQQQIANQDKINSLICPGCRYYNAVSFLTPISTGLACETCCHNYYNAPSDSNKAVYETFMEHTRKGYRCTKCQEFIPANSRSYLHCPYPGCDFQGDVGQFEEADHPYIKVKSPNVEFIDRLHLNQKPLSLDLPKFANNEDIQRIYDIIGFTIHEQLSTLHLRGLPSTVMLRQCMYQSFLKMLEQEPELMVEYLSKSGRNNRQAGIQAKIFQIFTKELEQSLPYSYIKYDQKITINSLLDPQLNLFDGESTFETVVENNIIPNDTQEVWTGSRAHIHTVPYYLGKLLSVELMDGKNLISEVQEHSCLEIRLKNHNYDTQKVRVKHLRIVPHYCAGGFTYLQRIKKQIVDKVVLKLKNEAK